MLEIQKLAYFMQEAGQALKLKFQKHYYGPYADNLRKVLERIDGHFIKGYGDGVGTNAPDTPITLLADAADEAESFLHKDNEVQERFDQVSNLIEGYETPYGMELLSSVHWVATQECHEARKDAGLAVQEVFSWNDHKRQIMKSEHIHSAWNTLRSKHWI